MPNAFDAFGIVNGSNPWGQLGSEMASIKPALDAAPAPTFGKLGG